MVYTHGCVAQGPPKPGDLTCVLSPFLGGWYSRVGWASRVLLKRGLHMSKSGPDQIHNTNRCQTGLRTQSYLRFYLKRTPPQCEHCPCILTVRHILVECNHFAQERKDIFGRRDVVESLTFHPTLICDLFKTN